MIDFVYFTINWVISDFIVAGTLLLITWVLIEIVIRNVQNSKYKIVIIFSIMAVLCLVWVELAVGIFGTPFSGS